MRQADGGALTVLGWTVLAVQVGRSVRKCRVFVAEIRSPGILGMEFLLSLGAIVNLKCLELQIGRERIRCVRHDGSQFSRVLIHETVELLPGHEHVVTGRVRCTKRPKGECMVEPIDRDELADNGLVFARVLVSAEEEIIPLRVYNPGKVTRTLQAGTKVGVLTPVEAVPESQACSGRVPGASKIPDHLRELYQESIKSVPGYSKEITSLFQEYQNVFSKGSGDLGRTNLVKHHIDTRNAVPIREVPRRHPLEHQTEIIKQVQDLLDRGVIEATSSPWASNIVLVAKKDGTKRWRRRGLNSSLRNVLYFNLKYCIWDTWYPRTASILIRIRLRQ
ncbi:uncharacterized protein LOC117118703 [Anneissia japonica]|uniref:uncharacterized protein LOC117118703 n=1 Tax=Anneissia japonica TaxID=1529436 RepID=UPI001425B9F9|nr:uncharacterized protein LOC117118703 [Anneissia japonica]